MMDSICQYVLAVVCITVACGIVQQLLTGNPHIGIIKIITGLMITVTVLSPLLQLDSFSLRRSFEDIEINCEWIIKEGERAATYTSAEIIKERTAEYICNKATAMGADISVDVELEETMPSIPSRVTVKGNLSPFAQKQLSSYIQKELGISKEAQVWIS